MLEPFLLYLISINVVTFFVLALDKRAAANGNSYGKRVPEARLLGLASSAVPRESSVHGYYEAWDGILHYLGGG